MISTNYYLAQFYQDFLSPNYKYEHCINKSFKETIRKCDFKQRLSLCNIKRVRKNNETKVYFYMTDWETFSKYTHLILSIYLNPIFSIIIHHIIEIERNSYL